MPKAKIKELFELKEGGTYWIITDEVRLHEMAELHERLTKHCPGMKFIITTNNIRPIQQKEVKKK